MRDSLGYGIAVVGAFVMMLLFISGSFSEDKPRTSFSVTDMTKDEQSSISSVVQQANDAQKDLDLYNSKIEVAQLKLTRLNEVVLPALVGELRDKYKLPPEDWTFDLKTFSFSKKPLKEASKE